MKYIGLKLAQANKIVEVAPEPKKGRGKGKQTKDSGINTSAFEKRLKDLETKIEKLLELLNNDNT